MAINLKIPAIKDKIGYQSNEIPLIKDKIKDINAKYGTYINNAARYNNLPKELVQSFIFIESAGNEKAKSSAKAIGLMQLTVQTANDVVRRELKNGKLTTSELAILRKYLGNDRSQGLLRSKWGSTDVFITENDLYIPELNIMLGTAYLGQIIDKLNDEQDLRLDKLIILYNRGFYTKIKEGDYMAVWSKQPSETKGYILKLIAKQGMLDILI